jgi:uncharacterized membrane protein YtjA (UPF0391 family)
VTLVTGVAAMTLQAGAPSPSSVGVLSLCQLATSADVRSPCRDDDTVTAHRGPLHTTMSSPGQRMAESSGSARALPQQVGSDRPQAGAVGQSVDVEAVDGASGRIGSRCDPQPCHHPLVREDMPMLSWALTFLIIGLVAGLLGLYGIAAVASQIAWVLFVVGIVLLIVHMARTRRAPPAV